MGTRSTTHTHSLTWWALEDRNQQKGCEILAGFDTHHSWRDIVLLQTFKLSRRFLNSVLLFKKFKHQQQAI